MSSSMGNDVIVYHGTNMMFDEIDLNKAVNRRDFGQGFYCTLLFEQAQTWANYMYMRNSVGKKYVYQYLFHQTEMLKIKQFTEFSEEWLEFVKKNRLEGGICHSYDVVIGPVTDKDTMETVQLYLSGILYENEAVKRLRCCKVNKQISFHTEKALECLHFERCKRIW